jgi:AraC-like DNA-binding protein
VLSTLQTLPYGETSLLFPERALPLRAMLGSIGHAREATPGYDWHGLRRGRAEFALLQYTLAGRGRLRVQAREFDVGPGHAMLLHFPDDNRYWLPEDSGGWEFFYVCLHGREILRLWQSIETRLGPLANLAPDSPAVACAARIVGRALRREVTDAFTASGLAYELVMALAAEARHTHPAQILRPGLDKARRFAASHLARPLTVDDLAHEAGLSRYHFSRLFAQHTGLAPAAWLIEQRVKEAARLLRSTKLPLKHIATQCGFPNANYLGRVFRRHTGVPPAAYRRSGA